MGERLVELKTVLAGPRGVLQPGFYPASLLAAYGYVTGNVSSEGLRDDGLQDEGLAGDGLQDEGLQVEGVGRPVTMIDGIGPKTAAALAAVGVDTVATLGVSDPEALAKKLDGVSVEKLAGWVDAAYELVLTNYREDEEE